MKLRGNFRKETWISRSALLNHGKQTTVTTCDDPLSRPNLCLCLYSRLLEATIPTFEFGSRITIPKRSPTRRIARNFTPRKNSMEPGNTPLEKESHLPNRHFQVLCHVNLLGCMFPTKYHAIPKVKSFSHSQSVHITRVFQNQWFSIVYKWDLKQPEFSFCKCISCCISPTSEIQKMNLVPFMFVHLRVNQPKISWRLLTKKTNHSTNTWIRVNFRLLPDKFPPHSPPSDRFLWLRPATLQLRASVPFPSQIFQQER